MSVCRPKAREEIPHVAARIRFVISAVRQPTRPISRSLACLDTVLYLEDHVVAEVGMPIMDTGAQRLGDQPMALFRFVVAQQRESLGASRRTIGERFPTLMGVSWQWSLL